ncbi:MAG: PHP-associated domain-containing protein [Halobacteriales archaeon]
MIGRDGFRVDLHVKVLDADVVERAKRAGLDALVYAPHFTRIDEARRAAGRFSDEELTVFPAREVFTGRWATRKHVLAVGLWEPIPDFITLQGAMAELDRQDAAVLVPHPQFLTVSLSAADVRTYRDGIDAVEVYNPKHWRHHNRRARELAAEQDLPGFASSYAHLPGTVGEAWTAFEEPLETTEDLVAAIRDGEYSPVHRTGWRHQVRGAAEFAHLGWENSWKKVDRVFLSGTAPTHPGHVAYDGRFDDVRVY